MVLQHHTVAQSKGKSGQMWTHTDIKRRIDPFFCNTFHFEVWAFIAIPIQPCLIDKVNEKLLLVIYMPQKEFAINWNSFNPFLAL